MKGGAAEQGDEADEAGASDGASQLIPGVVSRERRNISVMIRAAARGGRDGARVDGQRQAFERGGPLRD